MFAEAFAGFLAKIIAILGLSISLTITPVAPITESGHVSGSPIIGEQIAIATTSIGTQSTSSASLETRPKGSAWLTELPLGDGKYVTSGPKKGFIYLCNVGSAGGGAQRAGPWIHTDSKTWTPEGKLHVAGDISWASAATTIKISGPSRIITTNNVPTTHTSGVFPVASSDAAYIYDRNPNSISAQSFTFTLPANPTIAAKPSCIFGEVGIMTTGVLLFDGFDAGNRDAAAWEVQDRCDAHPQISGVYHYHNLSSCIKDISVGTVIGYAFDGFPITGPKLSSGNYLHTADLDECHGLTSSVSLNGKTVSTYHYVMTQDFPYSVSCFKGKRTVTGPLGGKPSAPTPTVSQDAIPSSGPGTTDSSASSATGRPPAGGPPQEAVAACSDLKMDDQCTFVSPMGDHLSGYCDTPPNSSMACVPR